VHHQAEDVVICVAQAGVLRRVRDVELVSGAAERAGA
jgi:hypothetical protein